MIEMSATIKNANGIHCRPSAVIAKEAIQFKGDIKVISGNITCDPRSVMALITLGLHEGAQVKIQITGPDEKAFCRKMVKLFETHYDFPPREDGEAPCVYPTDSNQESVSNPSSI